MQLADFLSAVFFYLKVGENLNQNWIVENLNNAFSTWNGKLGELWGLVTTGPQTFKGGAVWSVMQTLHNGMVGIGYALVVLFFAISLCKNTMNFHELKRPEAAIHYFLRFVAAKALVGYGMDIMLNVFSICNGIVTDMADSMGGISEAMVSLPAEMQTAIENVKLCRRVLRGCGHCTGLRDLLSICRYADCDRRRGNHYCVELSCRNSFLYARIGWPYQRL